MFLELLFKLGIAHAVTDLALQGPQFEAKLPTNKMWPYVLTAHALVNAGGVMVVTGSTELGVLEFIWHFCTDFCRTRNWLGTHGDQFSHAVSKLTWAYWGGA